MKPVPLQIEQVMAPQTNTPICFFFPVEHLIVSQKYK